MKDSLGERIVKHGLCAATTAALVAAAVMLASSFIQQRSVELTMQTDSQRYVIAP